MKKRDLQKQINALRRDLTAAGPKHDKLRDGLRLRDTQVERLVTRVNGLDERVNVVEAGRAIDIRAKAKLLDDALDRLGASNIDEMLKKLNWLHDRVDLLANKQDALAQRHDRVTYAVGQFDARLTRLEQHHGVDALAQTLVTASRPPRKRGRPRKAANGPAEPDAPKPLPMTDEETAQ